MVTQLTITRTYLSLYLKWVNFIVCKLSLREAGVKFETNMADERVIPLANTDIV